MAALDHLLPANATELERALGATIAGTFTLPATLAELQDYRTCPEDLLPYLAWERSVDVWDDDWPVERKRSVIGAAPAVHRVKGTIGAVRLALNAFGLEATVERWFEYGGDPHTLRVVLDASETGVTRQDLLAVTESVERTKAAHSLLESLRLAVTGNATSFVGIGLQQTVHIHQKMELAGV